MVCIAGGVAQGGDVEVEDGLWLILTIRKYIKVHKILFSPSRQQWHPTLIREHSFRLLVQLKRISRLMLLKSFQLVLQASSSSFMQVCSRNIRFLLQSNEVHKILRAARNVI